MAPVVARKTFIHPSKQMRILHEKLFQICSAVPHVQPHMNRLYTTGSAPTPDKSHYRTCPVTCQPDMGMESAVKSQNVELYPWPLTDLGGHSGDSVRSCALFANGRCR